MDIKANQDIKVRSMIPIQQISDCSMEWEINEHARLYLTATIIPSSNHQMLYQYMDSEIEVIMTGDYADGGEEVLLRGLVKSVEYEVTHGICTAKVEGISASVKLDRKKVSRTFQDVSMSYAQVIKKTAEYGGGNTICIKGQDIAIGKPYICCQETGWGFMKRLASQLNTYIVADVASGRPNLWFGMRQGKKGIDLQESFLITEVTKKYDGTGAGKSLVSYETESRKNYSLGDKCPIGGSVCVIYAKKVSLERGELLFRYKLAREEGLETMPYFNEDFTGLSLPGTICQTEQENVYLRLDIDSQEGEYPYPWKPETGNLLYAVPEIGAPAALYFLNHDERDAVAVRCLHRNGSVKHGNDDCRLKTLTAASGGHLNLYPGEIGIEKVGENKNQRVSLVDADGISAASAADIEMTAKGFIKMKAESILVSVPSKIKVTVKS